MRCSPALRSSSERAPTEAASETRCAATVSTSSVTALPTSACRSRRRPAGRSPARARSAARRRCCRCLVGLARDQDVDMIARQHEAGDTVDVVDPDGDGLHAVLDDGGERRLLPGSGDLRCKDRLVRLDRREHDALAIRRAARRSTRRSRRGSRLRARQPRAGSRARACRSAAASPRPRRSASRPACASALERLRPQLGLMVEPGLRDEHREQPEHDRNADHHDGVFAHARPHQGLFFCGGHVRFETRSFLKFRRRKCRYVESAMKAHPLRRFKQLKQCAVYQRRSCR